MQFLLLAYDATDEAALPRRMAAREAHMALVEKNKAAGRARYGAAIVDESGKMIGSMMVVEYESRKAVEDWLAEEPYITGKVWDKVTIQPCKIAPPFLPAT
jgi:uncharacterized protein YciI